jgi:transcriptional regulator with GAF, ATPase, and Fis domain
VDGVFGRIPVGLIEEGCVVAGERLETLPAGGKMSDLLDLNTCARGEGILSRAAAPIVQKGEPLGLIALDLRIGRQDAVQGLPWLRMIANHAAASLVNAQAFEEIKRLKKQLEQENAYLREELAEVSAFGEIIGNCPATLNVMRQIDLVAPTNATVLILGETGTGKELVAREIHIRSLRRERPMIKVNCPNIPKEIYESEFFGHARGAFTGAVKERAGRFEAAQGGTIMLDEVGEIPLELQSKLLRVLEEGQFERVGEDRARNVDVRILAATNKDLKKEMEAGRFREDLYYRLNVFPIQLAPLRERREDIPLLARHLLMRVATKMNRPVPSLSDTDVRELSAYDWPGNVRELQNVVERAMITSPSGTIGFSLPGQGTEVTAVQTIVVSPRKDRALPVVTDSEMKARMRDNIERALHTAQWKIYGSGGAAELLGMKPTTLCARIKSLGLRRPP